MEVRTPGRTVVLGLGNPVLCDDAVGLRVVAELKHLLADQPIPGVDVLASTRAGFELLDLLRGYSSAVIVDALDLPAAVPGRIRRLKPDDVRGSARLTNQHELGIGAVFALAERLGIGMPDDVQIVAVETADARSMAEELTPAVAAIVAPLARDLHAELAAAAPTEEPPDSEDFSSRRAFYDPEEG
jgi:hydrogenase maturation protease